MWGLSALSLTQPGSVKQMGAVDMLGRLFMWKFSNLDRESCYRQIEVRAPDSDDWLGSDALAYVRWLTVVRRVSNGSATTKAPRR